MHAVGVGVVPRGGCDLFVTVIVAAEAPRIVEPPPPTIGGYAVFAATSEDLVPYKEGGCRLELSFWQGTQQAGVVSLDLPGGVFTHPVAAEGPYTVLPRLVCEGGTVEFNTFGVFSTEDPVGRNGLHLLLPPLPTPTPTNAVWGRIYLVGDKKTIQVLEKKGVVVALGFYWEVDDEPFAQVLVKPGGKFQLPYPGKPCFYKAGLRLITGEELGYNYPFDRLEGPGELSFALRVEKLKLK